MENEEVIKVLEDMLKELDPWISREIAIKHKAIKSAIKVLNKDVKAEKTAQEVSVQEQPNCSLQGKCEEPCKLWLKPYED